MPGSTRLLSLTTVIWGVVFAAFHFYWAGGGDAGVEDADLSLGAAAYIASIAVLGLVGSAVAGGLDRPWGARVGCRRLRLAARLGGLMLLAGVVVGVGRWIAAGSLQGDGPAGVAITTYFLVGGLLFSTLGWRDRGEAD